jgi:uncharacterized membrane protein YkvA (DUF1232 family)
MWAILIRFAALAAVWGVSRWRRATAPAVVRDIERLGWASKGRLVWALSRDQRVPVWVRGIVVLPALYMISPIDILPDVLPVLGRIDDAAIFGLAMDVLARYAPKEVVEEHVDRLRRR